MAEMTLTTLSANDHSYEKILIDEFQIQIPFRVLTVHKIFVRMLHFGALHRVFTVKPENQPSDNADYVLSTALSSQLGACK